jgi:hypothetical protein
MSDESTGDSPQAIAYKLLQAVSIAEGKPLGSAKSDKAWVLETYKECLETVLHIRKWGPYT